MEKSTRKTNCLLFRPLSSRGYIFRPPTKNIRMEEEEKRKKIFRNKQGYSPLLFLCNAKNPSAYYENVNDKTAFPFVA